MAGRGKTVASAAIEERRNGKKGNNELESAVDKKERGPSRKFRRGSTSTSCEERQVAGRAESSCTATRRNVAHFHSGGHVGVFFGKWAVYQKDRDCFDGHAWGRLAGNMTADKEIWKDFEWH